MKLSPSLSVKTNSLRTWKVQVAGRFGIENFDLVGRSRDEIVGLLAEMQVAGQVLSII